MATNLTPLSTDFLPRQQARKSREILQCATSPQDALKAAKQLIGQWPHAKPPDLETYAAAIAAALAGYPLGIVQECCDPRVGLAREREFPPTVACLVAWCDRRLTHHRTLAAWQPALLPAQTRQELRPDDEMAARVAQLFRELAEQLRNSAASSPLDRLIEERADARRLRIEEVMRRAEAAKPEAAE